MGKHTQIILTKEDWTEVEGLLHKGELAARVNTRARILLLSDRSQGEQRGDQEVATAVSCSLSTVGITRKHYLQEGLKRALYDKGWPGAKPKLTGEIEAQLTVLACSAPPEGRARWTLELLGERLVELGYLESVSPSTVGEWLKKQ